MNLHCGDTKVLCSKNCAKLFFIKKPFVNFFYNITSNYFTLFISSLQYAPCVIWN